MEADHNGVSTFTVLPIKESNTIEWYMKCHRMVSIKKSPGDYDIFRHKPDSSSVIYMTVVM